MKYSGRILTAVILVTATISTLNAQDSVFLFKADGKPGKENGRITAADPDGVTINGQKVPSSVIRKITIGREPSALSRARDHFENGQYADCIQQLGKLDPVPTEPLLVADIDFMKAYSNAQICLLGGNVAPLVAGRAIGEFLQKHPSTYHLHPATECFGQLKFAYGDPKLAASEFQKLKKAGWTEYRLRGHFYYGKMMELGGDTDAAIKSYDEILAERGNDDATQNYQTIAKIEKAKLGGLKGNAAGAIANLKTMIAGDAENALTFGHLYNALGALYEVEGDLKNASISYLKTQLIYAAAEGPHAEALYRLTQIWPKLNKNDRANQARDILKSTYRNSYWAQKKKQ